MTKREILARYYQNISYTYYKRAQSFKESLAIYDGVWKWFRWTAPYSRTYMVKEYKDNIVMSSAYAYTSRILMGIEE